MAITVLPIYKHSSAPNGALRMRMILLCFLVLLAGGFGACKRAEQTTSPQAKRYELQGKVVSFDKEKKEVTVSHEEVPGYMPAMTMPFPLKDEWAFDALAKGSKISATLVVDADSFWLEGIVISASASDPTGSGQPESPTDPKVGQEVPNFKLINQDGKEIKIQQFRGKVLLLTFIYTRCPLPEYCTLMSNNFAAVNKSLRETPDIRARTHLLSITVDPTYDTPKVLRSYGAAHTDEYDRASFEHWEFATGKPEEIKRAAEFFGLSYFPEKNEITHSLRTALIAPDGKVHKIYPGNDWRPAEVYSEVQSVLAASGHKTAAK